ncbi:hypothetical protein ACKVMT_00870 [Halobacteriales archaeon Cl-PHB]
MADQEYVYETHRTEVRPSKMESIAAVANEYASEGWQLVETLEVDGTTVGLVFEREIRQD